MKNLILSVGVFGLLAVQGTQVKADPGDVIANFATNLITGAIVSHQHQLREQRREELARRGYKAPRGPVMTAAQRQQNREVQKALNYFNYPVGAVDGALGQKSRAAIRQLQEDLGFEADGRLEPYERAFLVRSYYRAQAGVTGAYARALASYGPRGLLRSYRNELAGSGTATTAQSVGVTPTLPAPKPQQPVAAALPKPGAVAVAPLGAFAPLAGAPVSPASVCELPLTKDAAEARPAMDRQFCDARQFVMEDGEAKRTEVSGATPEQINALCDAIKERMEPILLSLPGSAPDAIVAAVSAKVEESGSTADQFVTSAQICLGQAYANDDAEAAIASAALLVAGGEESYGELIGHHLRNGAGVLASEGQAVIWQTRTLSALDEGAVPAILPARASARAADIRKAMGLSVSPAPLQPLLAPVSAPQGELEASAGAALSALPELELIMDSSQ